MASSLVPSPRRYLVPTSSHDEVMKAKQPESVEGTEAWTRFQGAMRKVLSVPHAEIQRRIEAERKAAAKNPHKARAEAQG